MTDSPERLPYWPAALNKQMAAVYCGLTYETFTKHCPVKPIEFTGSARGRRYLRHRLDEWLLAIDPNGPTSIPSPDDWNCNLETWDEPVRDHRLPPEGIGGYLIIEDPNDPIRKWYDSIGFDPRTMGREDMTRLMETAHEEWAASIPGTPLIKRELTVLGQLATYGVGEKIHRTKFKCGPDTEDRLKARGYLVTFPDERFPERIGYYMFTETAGEAWAAYNNSLLPSRAERR